MIDNKNVSIKEKKKKIIISAGMVFVSWNFQLNCHAYQGMRNERKKLIE